MSRIWKTLKVFISSTFLDLEAERDQLNRIFLEIEQEILERQLVLRPYDLRWEEHNKNESLIAWCLKIVEQCQYFIGILGHRYGWHPPTMEDGQNNEKKISIIEMEINKAIAKIPKEHRFFFFGNFRKEETEKEETENLNKLKQRLQENGETIFTYQNAEELLQAIKKEFLTLLNKKFPPEKKVPPITFTYTEALREIVVEKAQGFVGRTSLQQKIKEFIALENTPNYLVIQGATGAGKSALLAQFIKKHKDEDELPIIAHFMGMGGDAREINGIIANIGQQLYKLKIIDQLDSTPTQARIQVFNALKIIKRKMIVVLDGVDEICKNGRNLLWLPQNLPGNIRIIISTRPVDTWDILREFPHIEPLELPPLEDEEVEAVAKAHSPGLERGAAHLLQGTSRNFLYLKVALEELNSRGLTAKGLARPVEKLFEEILERLEQKYSPELINNYLGLIAAGRSGIQEKELAEILKLRDETLLPIARELSNFVVVRRGFLNFFHNEFERVVKMRLGKAELQKLHQLLAGYLKGKGFGYLHTLDELPYQLQWAELYEDLLATLTDIEFLEAKSSMGMLIGLEEDLSFAVASIPKEIQTQKDGVVVSQKTVLWLHRAMKNDLNFLQKHPQSLFQFIFNRFYWHDCPAANEHYRLDEKDAPWHKEGNHVHTLVESWRNKRQGQGWLKSLRPLPIRLDSGLIKVLRGHTASLECVKFSPDGQKIVSGGWDNTICIWEVATGVMLQSIIGHSDWIYSVSFSPDNQKIVSSSRDSTIRIWDAKSGQEIKVIDSHQEPVHSVAFSPDGTKLVSGSKDQIVCIWDAQTGEALHYLQGHEKTVLSVQFSPDGQKIVSASFDKTVRIWDANNGEILHTLSGHETVVEYATFSHDGQKIASASKDRNIGIWDASSGKLLNFLTGHEGEVYSVDFSKHGKVASCSIDKTIRIWDAQTANQEKVLYGHQSNILSVNFSPDGEFLVSGGGGDRCVCIWDTTLGKRDFVLRSHSNKVMQVNFSLQGDKIVSASRDCCVGVWDVEKGTPIHTLKGHKDWVCDAVFSPDGSKVASASHDKTVRIWEVETGKELRVLFQGRGNVKCVAFSPDGSKVASAGSEKKIIIWDTNTGKIIGNLYRHDKIILALNYSPDGAKLVSGSRDRTVRIWDVETGKMLNIFKGHRSEIVSVAFTPDSAHIISCCMGNVIHCWNIESGKSVKKLKGVSNVFTLANQEKYQVLAQQWQTTLQTKDNEKDIAFFPGKMEGATISKNNVVAGYAGNDIYLLQLQT